MRSLFSTILTALPVLSTALLFACGSGCGELGVANVSSCGNTTASTAAPTNVISGGVSGTVLQGVLITLSGAASVSATTNASGAYSFSGLTAGNYTVTPSLAGYTFSPASNAVTLASGGTINGNNFTESAYTGVPASVSGTVSGAVAQNVLITLSGANTGSTTSDASGNYGFTGLAAGGYTLTPSLAGYTFSPASIALSAIAGGAVSGSNFTATAYSGSTSSLSGAVSGAVAQNVLVTLSGTATGSALTDANGNYSFAGLIAGSYTVTPTLSGYTFSPASSTVTTIGGANASVGNFTALP